MLFDVRTSLFGIMNQYDLTVDLWSSDFLLHLEDNLIYYCHILGLCDLYFIAQ